MKRIVSCCLVGILLALPFAFAACSGEGGAKKGTGERESKGRPTTRVSGYQGGRKAVQRPPTSGEGSAVPGASSAAPADDAATRTRSLKQAKDCQKAFERCVENCRGEGCEDTCLAYLAECEASLPKDLQMLKK